MWFPVDQPGYRERHPDEVAAIRRVLECAGVEGRRPAPRLHRAVPRGVRGPPGQLRTTTSTPSPRPIVSGAGTSSTGCGATSTPPTRGPGSGTSTTTSSSTGWPTGASAPCSAALEAAGAWDDTVVIFTSDHGDMCGSHGLRSKGPFVYDEIMRVPLYVRGARASRTRGSATSALGTHVDLAATICALAGVDRRGGAQVGDRCRGSTCPPVLADPAAHGARPHPVRPGLGPDTETQQGPLRPARLLRRPHQVRALLRRRRRQAVDRAVGQVPAGTSSSTSTATSTTTTTSGTTTTPTRSSWSTWPTTGPGATSSVRCSNGSGRGRPRRWPPSA